MTQDYALFFDSYLGDRRYNAQDLRDFFSLFVSNGIYGKDTNQLKISPHSGLTVQLSQGFCFINGAIRNVPSTMFTLNEGHTSYSRYDAIALRFDTSLRTINSILITGSPSATPTLVQPTRNASQWDLILAHIYVPANTVAITESYIMDRRGYSQYCPYVYNAVQEVDTSGIFSQFQAAWDLLIAGFSGDEADVIDAFEALMDFDTLHVGNVNLFKNSGFNGTTGWETYGAPTVAVNDGVISVTVTDAFLQWICPSDISMFKHGATYTIQAWLKADMPIKMRIGAAWGNKVVDVTTEWALYTYTYTTSTTDGDNYIRPVFGTNAPYNNTTFYVKQPKIVEGNHITASWEPSPYDIPQCIQAGKITTDNTGKATVTFPRAFSSAPAVYATSHYSNTGTVFGVQVLSVSATGCVLYNSTWGSSYSSAGQPVAPIQWLAIGT